MSNSRYLCKVNVGQKYRLKNGDTVGWWHCSDLIRFADWLDEEYPDWLWFNVFDNMSEGKLQIANYTQRKRPKSKIISYSPAKYRNRFG